jgi:nicotinamidase-related amidase
MPHATQMSAADTALLVVDVQEKLLPKIRDHAALVRNIRFLLDGAKLLQIPAQTTEQYPRGLGATVPDLIGYFPERPDKTAFSSCACPSVVERFHRGARTKIVVTGIETHVCVLHTTLDLLAANFRVYLPVDAVGARYRIDHDTALRRLEQAGAILTTSESCLFEWLGGSSHPQFKAASLLVQERMKQLSAD